MSLSILAAHLTDDKSRPCVANPVRLPEGGLSPLPPSPALRI